MCYESHVIYIFFESPLVNSVTVASSSLRDMDNRRG